MKYICPFGCKTAVIRAEPGDRWTLKESGKELKFVPAAGVVEEGIEGKGGLLKVGSAWDFDNVGVSKNLGDSTETTVQLTGPDGKDAIYTMKRLLTCGACDIGPIGFAGYAEGATPTENPNELDYFVLLE